MAAFTLDAKQNREATGLGVLKGAALGATTGASIGTAVTPGIGTAIGAVVGGVAGGIRGGVTDGLVDKGEQKAIYDAEQDALKAKKNANIDYQASARSLPKAASYTGTNSMPYATPGAGQTSYDAWKGGY